MRTSVMLPYAFLASTWMQICDVIALGGSREEDVNYVMKHTAIGPYYGNLCGLVVPYVICQDKFPRGLDGGASTIFRSYYYKHRSPSAQATCDLIKASSK